MIVDFTPPPEELATAFDSLTESLKSDTTGDRTRRLIEYFAGVEMEARQKHLRSVAFQEKEANGVLAEAHAASQRVLAKAWANLHGKELA